MFFSKVWNLIYLNLIKIKLVATFYSLSSDFFTYHRQCDSVLLNELLRSAQTKSEKKKLSS